MAKHGDSKRLAASARKIHARNMRLVRVFSVAIAVCTAFALGFFLRGNDALLSVLGFASLNGGGAATTADAQGKTAYNSLSERVSEVEDALLDDSLDSFDLDTATSSVLDAFSETTQDAYFRYYDAARYQTLLQAGGDGYMGIGALFAECNGKAYVVDVFEGSTAQLAGVREGDFVVAIDGDRGHDWSQAEVVGALNREEGASVVITWRRPESLEAEGGEEFTTTLTCAKSTEPNVVASLEGEVGCIELKQITSNAAELVRSAIADLEAQGALSFVLDIRDNPGGYLTQAVDVASLFVKSGTVVQIQTKDGKGTKSATGDVATDKPLVVLVNENTAAAAEVLASALQDSQRATLVGATTLGKGSVQVVREMSFGGALRYTTAYYLTSQGHDINDVGVAPNVVVNSGEEQRGIALETAASLIAG